jgi:hypothetical protein
MPLPLVRGLRPPSGATQNVISSVAVGLIFVPWVHMGSACLSFLSPPTALADARDRPANQRSLVAFDERRLVAVNERGDQLLIVGIGTTGHWNGFVDMKKTVQHRAHIAD